MPTPPDRGSAPGTQQRGHVMAAPSVLVQVDEVAVGVVEDRVGAAVGHPAGFLGKPHALGPEPLGFALAVVGAQRQHRPAWRQGCWNALAGASARCSTGCTPSGSSGATTPSQLVWAVGGARLDLQPEHLGVEPLGLVLVLDVDAG